MFRFSTVLSTIKEILYVSLENNSAMICLRNDIKLAT